MDPAGQKRGVVADRDVSGHVRVNEDGKSPADSYRRTLNWYIGRRPRTAFSSVQVNVELHVHVICTLNQRLSFIQNKSLIVKYTKRQVMNYNFC